MKANKQTEKIINLIKMNPTMDNKELVQNYELSCHPNNISNIRRRFNLPRSPCRNNRRPLEKKESPKTENTIRLQLPVNNGNTNIVNDYTKYRFIAELMGYRGSSLNLRGYKSWIKKNL